MRNAAKRNLCSLKTASSLILRPIVGDLWPSSETIPFFTWQNLGWVSVHQNCQSGLARVCGREIHNFPAIATSGPIFLGSSWISREGRALARRLLLRRGTFRLGAA